MAAQHVDPEEAVQIILDLEAKAALGIHWGTLRLTYEDRDEPATRLAVRMARRSEESRRFVAMAPADIIRLS